MKRKRITKAIIYEIIRPYWDDLEHVQYSGGKDAYITIRCQPGLSEDRMQEIEWRIAKDFAAVTGKPVVCSDDAVAHPRLPWDVVH